MRSRSRRIMLRMVLKAFGELEPAPYPSWIALTNCRRLTRRVGPSGFLESRTAARSWDTSMHASPLLLKLDRRHWWGRGAVPMGRSFHGQPSVASRALIALTDCGWDNATERKSSALPVYLSTCC